MIIKVLFIVSLFFIIRNIMKSLAHYNKLNPRKKDNIKNDDIVDAEYTVIDDDK